MSDQFPTIDPGPNDIVIAVMGMTGSGKSTFISLCTGEDVVIGHKLESCTQDVNVYRCRWSSTIDVYLVDTPGFDDTTRSDTEVLQAIAHWLAKSFENNVKLNGMIYLHRIIDPRVGGSAKKNLFMFKKICGTQALTNVLLVTTMWELAQPTTGETRETELINTEDFWGLLVKCGAQVQRHDNSRESAMGLLKHFVGKEQVVMSIQKEMIDEHKDLHETQAGMQLDAEIVKATDSLRKDLADTHEMMKQALEARDQESAEMLRRYEMETQRKFEMMTQEREKLKVTLNEMHERQRGRDEETKLELRRLREELNTKAASQQTHQTQEQYKLMIEREETQNELTILRKELAEAKADRKPLEDALMQAMEQLKVIESLRPSSSDNRSHTKDSSDIERFSTELAREWKTGKARSVCLNGHEGSVYCLQFDDDKIITGSRDMTIRIWDINTFKCRLVIGPPDVLDRRETLLDRDGDPAHFATLSDKRYAVTSMPATTSFRIYHDASILALRYDDKILVTTSSDCTCIVYDVRAEYRPIRQLRHHTNSVLNVAFDNKYIVSCSSDRTICVWDRKTWDLLRQLEGHSAAVNTVRIFGNTIASCSGDSTVRLWNIRTGEVIRKFRGHDGGVACLQISKDGNYIISGGRDATIRIWNTNTGECVRKLYGHDNLVRALHVDPDGTRLVSADYDGDVKVWDLETERQLLDFPKQHTGWAQSIQSDRKRIVSSGKDGRVCLLDFSAGIENSLR